MNKLIDPYNEILHYKTYPASMYIKEGIAASHMHILKGNCCQLLKFLTLNTKYFSNQSKESKIHQMEHNKIKFISACYWLFLILFLNWTFIIERKLDHHYIEKNKSLIRIFRYNLQEKGCLIKVKIFQF